MDLKDYIQYDAIGLNQLIREKKIGPHEPLSAAIELAEQLNPKLNAITHLFINQAEQLYQSANPNTALYGVPILLKNLGFALKDTSETYGSHYFGDNPSEITSDFVNILLKNGCIPFGRTNTPELGLSFATEPLRYGPTRNPWDLKRTSGGSSGGAAAAVAAGIVPIATANDGGGSIRVPAACCGLFGFKPTRGLTPCGPYKTQLWSGLAVSHVITRSVRDSAFILNLLNPYGQPNINWLESPPEKLKIGLLTGPFTNVPIDPVYKQSIDKTINLLKSMGHEITPIEINIDLALKDKQLLKIIAANIAYELLSHSDLILKNPDSVEPITYELFKQGQHISATELLQAKYQLAESLMPLKKFNQKIDMFLTPSLAQLPVSIGHLRGDDDFEYFNKKNIEFSPFTSLFNQTGQPAMTIPIDTTPDGLPISIQLAGHLFDDYRLLQLAYAIEQANPFSRLNPLKYV